MRNKGFNIALLTILFLGIFIIGEASYKEFLYGNVCANFTIIPTCYIALVYLILLLVFQLKKNGDIWFLFLSGFAVVLATFASVGHLLGTNSCSISDVGVPTCFIGFILFATLLGVKLFEDKSNKKP